MCGSETHSRTSSYNCPLNTHELVFLRRKLSAARQVNDANAVMRAQEAIRVAT